ncbi:hydroxyglutarate oxidase [Marinococcus halophilus]|uniref:Hydroxyglutarate oxidase n=1 Tax=Marinococcus halophilus TaxID=1371 RepID=A0A510Y375_MARHA|nr:L-2-hydroxyglutarate oxidase [Marinococcus halophilus]OZT81811.1 hydroxyglutarate oxidase [Marinococcus halophilus]GEK57776.1 hydroxyglutarate oxidase [Marinococcus halophilus]
MYDYVIIGGGILGLATAYALLEEEPGAGVVVLEKESHLASHQTGRNSGVIHSGIYYQPGSLKAVLTEKGRKSLTAFCDQHGVDYTICGKIIAARDEDELLQLRRLYERGRQNGLQPRYLSLDELAEREPYVSAQHALLVPETGIVDYAEVADALAREIRRRGGDILIGQQAQHIQEEAQTVSVTTRHQTFTGRKFINCGGLHSDKIARIAGYHTDVRIVPFRGEYYTLTPEAEHKVSSLIYPVPDPAFPFLGVHFTRMSRGGVEAGPNAVLSFGREGYGKLDMNPADAWEHFRSPGLMKLASRYWRKGAQEYVRSFSKQAFTKELQQLIPSLLPEELMAGEPGIRAQAIQEDGTLLDDFFFITGSRSLHVLNAPSPAATASLEIGKTIAQKVKG